MLRSRVIPCLDVAGDRVVKGTNFRHLIDQGDPVELAARYTREGADEICYLDINAAPEQRPTLLEMVRRTARRVSVPLTVGGGVRSVDDMRATLRSGADKVGLNTAAVVRPELLAECASTFGRQCVVLAVDACRSATGYEVVIGGGRHRTGLDAIEWSRTGAGLGAGEILLTSIDRDGTSQGFDLALIEAVCAAVAVPVIASGGAGRPEDFVAALAAGASAVLAAGTFHRGELSIPQVKAALAAAGWPVREVA